MSLKTIDTPKQAGGNRPLKQQTAEERAFADYLCKTSGIKYATIVNEFDGELWACKMPLSRLLKGLCLSNGKAKILAPFGKKQLMQMIDDAEDLELIGTVEDLDDIIAKKGGRINRGQAVEYFIARKYHCKFDHIGRMTTNGGEFRGTELKYFGWSTTTGTPSATCEQP